MNPFDDNTACGLRRVCDTFRSYALSKVEGGEECAESFVAEVNRLYRLGYTYADRHKDDDERVDIVNRMRSLTRLLMEEYED